MVSLRARIDNMKQRGLRSLLSKPETISNPNVVSRGQTVFLSLRDARRRAHAENGLDNSVTLVSHEFLG